MRSRTAVAFVSNARFRINEDAFADWLGERKDFFANKYSLARPTLKNAVCLALIDSLGQAIAYEEIEERIVNANVVCDDDGRKLKTIPIDALRIAISQVSRRLEESHAPYFIRSQRASNKKALYRLVQSPDQMTRLAEMAKISRGRQPDGAAPAEISKKIVTDAGGLPFAAIYTHYRAAAAWIYESKSLSNFKSQYEAEALDGYSLKRLLPQHRGRSIGVVGLGVGEGQGEVALLRKLLAETDEFESVHYLAVDSSEMLLVGHACLVRDLFREEIEKKRLVFCPVQGDLFRLIDQVGVARERHGDSFLSGMSVIGTYFGNNLGNQENDEMSVFRSLFSAFPENVSVAALVGISLLRREGDDGRGNVVEDVYQIESLELDTPRALIQEQRYLVSLDENGNEIPPDKSIEFTKAAVQVATGYAPIPSAVYKTDLGIVGRVYRFHYSLVHGLKCKETGAILPAGTRIHISSVIKYDLRSVKSALERHGAKVLAPPNQFRLLKAEDEGRQFRYAVLGVLRGEGRRL